MDDTEKVVYINLTSSSELTSSLLEQLGKAFVELEAHKVASTRDVLWKDVEEHFHHMESMMKKKLEELEAKEKVFAERESHKRMLTAEKETAVVAKEQDLLDKIQELKDAAVATIAEARANHIAVSAELASGVDADGNQVSDSNDDENAQEEENAEGMEMEVNSRAELTQFCEQMDSKGLLKFITENLKNLSVMKNLKKLSDVCKEQLAVVLGSATEPARLVLEALEGFFPSKETTQEGDEKDAATTTSGMLQSCILLMEALSSFLSKAESGADNFLNPEIKQHSLSIANEWKPKLVGESNDDADNVNSLEAEGFLRLLATFRIGSEFDQDELCKYVLAVAHHRQATELCHFLGLTQKIPGLVDTLISSGRPIDAVHFIHAFQLVEVFPTVPLLKAYLKELRRNSQGNGHAAVQNECNARELDALRAVIECVEEYKLEAAYGPLDTLHKRVAQLQKSVRVDRKRTGETVIKKLEPKKPRANGEFQGSRPRSSGGGRQGPPSKTERVSYTGLQERYPPPPAAPGAAYNYAVSPYAAQATTQRPYYYAEGTRPREPYTAAAAVATAAAAAPSYGAYMQPSTHPYM